MHLVSCGSGEPILFIHGMPTNGRLWSGIIERLCGSYQCFAIDLPGLGKSPCAKYGPRYLQSLAERIDAIRMENNIAKWHVVGHDAGSAVAVHYAHYFPEHVDHLALLSPALFPELRPYYLIEPLRKAVLGELLAPFIRTIFWRIAMNRALESTKDGGSMRKDFYKPFAGAGGAWKFMRVMRWGKPEQVLAEVPGFLAKMLMPTMILHGSGDVAIPEAFAHRATRLMPNATMHIVDSGHFIPLSQPATVAKSLDQFFHAGKVGPVPGVNAEMCTPERGYAGVAESATASA
jgi:pimeloyl-ACP methyl ester carboxylesterase